MEHLYGADVDMVDWRQFVLCAALPWPLPSSQDLLKAWDALVSHQQTVGRKMVTKQHFMDTEIWLDKTQEELAEELADKCPPESAEKSPGSKDESGEQKVVGKPPEMITEQSLGAEFDRKTALKEVRISFYSTLQLALSIPFLLGFVRYIL